MRTRAYAWFDSRQQTEYGTLRSYLQIGVNYDSPNASSSGFNANRAFIQFAGFTVGTAQSFFDFYSSPASSFFGPPASDTGDGGWKVFAYTAQYGNGFSATFSIEEPRSGSTGPISGVIDTNLGNLVLGTNTSDTDRAKHRFPDLVQNWRVDQAWGSAQLMIAAHDVSGGYYAASGTPLLGAVTPCSGPTSGFLGVGTGTLTGSEVCGHPADKLGWAAGGGSGTTWGLPATTSSGRPPTPKAPSVTSPSPRPVRSARCNSAAKTSATASSLMACSATPPERSS